MLAIAQEQRLKSSPVQAFWPGYGQEDGIEAAELANVRGEKEARATMLSKNKGDIPGDFLKLAVPPPSVQTRVFQME